MSTVHPTSPTTAPLRKPVGHEQTKVWGVMAEFSTPSEIIHAANAVREAGYRWWDCHTPFPVHGLDKAMGIRATWLPWFVFGAGLTGAIIGALLQWFTNATQFDMWALVDVIGYRFIISGKPFASVPAWIPVMFELTILLASLTAFGLMFLFNGLPRFYHPTLKSEKFRRATDDRFFLVIESRDPRFYRRRTEEMLSTLNPLSIEALEA